MMRRLIQRFLREEDGIALVIAIATMSVLAITTAGIMVAGSANEHTAWTSTQGRAAFAVAQEALAYGEGMVYADVQSSPSVTPPSTTQSLPSQPGGATGTYLVTQSGTSWHIAATGTVGTVSRTVSVDLTPTQTTSTQSYALWNYLYIDSLSCVGATLSGGTTVTMPILARGDLCLQGSSTSVLNTVEVGGSLSFTGNPKIGTRLALSRSSRSSAPASGSLPAPAPATAIATTSTHRRSAGRST